MSWVIRGYERNGELLRSERSLDDELREFFRSLLQLSPDDPLVDSYRIPEPLIRQLAGRFGIDLEGDGDQKYFLDWDS